MNKLSAKSASLPTAIKGLSLNFGKRCFLMRQQLRAVFGRRLAEDFLEHAVEVRKRLEADFKGDLTHAQIRIEQKVFGFFNADAGNVVGEIDAGDLFEHLAEVKTAHVDGLGDLAELDL